MHCQIKDGEKLTDLDEKDQLTIDKQKLYTKGRIRSLKTKVWNILKLPDAEWNRHVGAEWLARLEVIKLTSGFNEFKNL